MPSFHILHSKVEIKKLHSNPEAWSNFANNLRCLVWFLTFPLCWGDKFYLGNEHLIATNMHFHFCKVENASFFLTWINLLLVIISLMSGALWTQYCYCKKGFYLSLKIFILNFLLNSILGSFPLHDSIVIWWFLNHIQKGVENLYSFAFLHFFCFVLFCV